MEKILEALKKLLPAESVKEVSAALDQMFQEAKADMEAEYNVKLQEAYAELSEEITNNEKIATDGYAEAYTVINDLRNRLDTQKEEFEAALEEGYEEAYQMLVSERKKNASVGHDLYEEYDKKLAEMKAYIVEKMDQFLQFKGSEIYNQARRDINSDPRMAEHKVALDKIVDIAVNYADTENRTAATSGKLEEAYRSIENLKAQVKLSESRCIQLDMQNRKLNESVKQSQAVVNESRKADRTERVKKSENVTGRGRIVEDNQVEVIKEHQAPAKAKSDNAGANILGESVAELDVLQKLAGVKTNS